MGASTNVDYGGVADMDIHTDAPTSAHNININITHTDTSNPQYGSTDISEGGHAHTRTTSNHDSNTQHAGVFRFGSGRNVNGAKDTASTATPVFVFGQKDPLPTVVNQSVKKEKNTTEKTPSATTLGFGSDRTNTLPTAGHTLHSKTSPMSVDSNARECGTDGTADRAYAKSKVANNVQTPQKTNAYGASAGNVYVAHKSTVNGNENLHEGVGLFGKSPTTTTPDKGRNIPTKTNHRRSRKPTQQPKKIVYVDLVDSDSDVGVDGQANSVNTSMNNTSMNNSNVNNASFDSGRNRGKASEPTAQPPHHTYRKPGKAAQSTAPKVGGHMRVPRNKTTPQTKAPASDFINLISSEDEAQPTNQYLQANHSTPKGAYKAHTLHMNRPQARPSPRTQVNNHARAQKQQERVRELHEIERREAELKAQMRLREELRQQQQEAHEQQQRELNELAAQRQQTELQELKRHQQQQQQQQQQWEQQEQQQHLRKSTQYRGSTSGPAYAHIPPPASAPTQHPPTPETPKHTATAPHIPGQTPRSQSSGERRAPYSSAKKPRRSTSDTSEDTAMPQTQSNSGTNNGTHMELSQDGDVSTVTDMEEDGAGSNHVESIRQSSVSATPQLHAHRSRRRPGVRHQVRSPTQQQQQQASQGHTGAYSSQARMGEQEGLSRTQTPTHTESQTQAHVSTPSHAQSRASASATNHPFTATAVPAGTPGHTNTAAHSVGAMSQNTVQTSVGNESLAFKFANISGGAPVKFGTSEPSQATESRPNGIDALQTDLNNYPNISTGGSGLANVDRHDVNSSTIGTNAGSQPRAGVFRFGANEPSSGGAQQPSLSGAVNEEQAHFGTHSHHMQEETTNNLSENNIGERDRRASASSTSQSGSTPQAHTNGGENPDPTEVNTNVHRPDAHISTQHTSEANWAGGSSIPSAVGEKVDQTEDMDVLRAQNTSCLDDMEKLSVVDSSVTTATELAEANMTMNSPINAQQTEGVQNANLMDIGSVVPPESLTEANDMHLQRNQEQETTHAQRLAQPTPADLSNVGGFGQVRGTTPSKPRTHPYLHTHKHRHKHDRMHRRTVQKRDSALEKCPYVTEKRGLGKTKFMAQDYQGAVVAYSEAIEHIETMDPTLAADGDDLSLIAGADRCPYHQVIAEEAIAAFDFGMPIESHSAQIDDAPSFSFVANFTPKAIVFGQNAQESMPAALEFKQPPTLDNSTTPTKSMPEALAFDQHTQTDADMPEARTLGPPPVQKTPNEETRADVSCQNTAVMDTSDEANHHSSGDMTHTGDILRDMDITSEARTPPDTQQESGLNLVDPTRETVRDTGTMGDGIATTATTTHDGLSGSASVGVKDEGISEARIELAQLYTNRGLCHSKLMAYNRAHQDWYRAIEINESDLKPLVSLTKLQIRLGELRVANTFCTDGLLLCKKYPAERNQKFEKDLVASLSLLSRLQQARKTVCSWCAETFEINLTETDTDASNAQTLQNIEKSILELKKECPESVLFGLYHVRLVGYAMGEYDRAVELVEPLIKSHPGNLGVSTEAAHCYLQSVDFERCGNVISAVFNGLNKQADNDRDPFTGCKQSQLTQQMKATKKLMNRMKNARILANTAYTHKQYEHSIKLYTEALTIAPDNKRYCALIHNNMAAAYRVTRDLTQATHHVKAALTLHPTYLPALRREITLMLETGKAKATLAKLEALLKEYPGDEMFEKQLQIGQKKVAQAGQAAADALRLRIEKQSHYEAMGLERTATSSEIKKAYRSLVLKYHPDKTQTDDEVVKAESDIKFKRVQQAYETLKDETLRRRYDLTLRATPSYSMRQPFSTSSSNDYDYYPAGFGNPQPRQRQNPFDAARGARGRNKGRSKRGSHF